MSSSTSSTPSLSVSPETRVRIQLATLFALLTTVALASVAWTSLRGDVLQQARAIETADQRLRLIEQNQAEIALLRRDVEWIRAAMEKR